MKKFNSFGVVVSSGCYTISQVIEFGNGKKRRVKVVLRRNLFAWKYAPFLEFEMS